MAIPTGLFPTSPERINPNPANVPPQVITHLGPILSCVRPPIRLPSAKQIIAKVNGKPAWLLVHSQPPSATGLISFLLITLHAYKAPMDRFISMQRISVKFALFDCVVVVICVVNFLF
jgi:hypothetical protein